MGLLQLLFAHCPNQGIALLRALLPGRQVTSQLKHRIGITILGGFLLFLGTRSSRGFSDIGNLAARLEPCRFASRAFFRVGS